MLRITFANVIPRCKYSLFKVPTLASSLPVLLTASRRPCDGRGAEVWLTVFAYFVKVRAGQQKRLGHSPQALVGS